MILQLFYFYIILEGVAHSSKNQNAMERHTEKSGSHPCSPGIPLPYPFFTWSPKGVFSAFETKSLVPVPLSPIQLSCAMHLVLPHNPSVEGLDSREMNLLPFHSQRIRIREGTGSPLQYSCLETPMDGRAW